ncbi:MAG: hypothetical protein GC206_00430 [Alphaproteobacteria bacterium]|nr:hypothetical protein [Alphaproteobacteria bacterium]
MRALFLAVALAACVSAPPAPRVSADPVIAAERAFAAEAAQRGWAAAFRAWHAPDAMVLSPAPMSAADSLARVEGDGETTLDWRPAYAGMALSGDFGFTTGPFLFRGQDRIAGHYFTVWRKQTDGTWKWIFDAGTPVADPGPAIAADASLPILPVADEGVGDAAADAIRDLETHIHRARPDPAGRLRGRLAEDVRLNRPGRAPAIGREAADAAVATTGIGSSEPLWVEASAAGDLAFVLGAMPDDAGHYARIWQRRDGDWVIVFDEIVPGGSGN